MHDRFRIVLARRLVRVRLDRSDVGRLRAHELFNKRIGGKLCEYVDVERLRAERRNAP